MTLVDLKRMITSNELFPVHVFYGIEYAIMNEFTRMICDKRGSYKYFMSAKSVYDVLRLKSPIIDIPPVIIVYEDHDVLSDELLWDDLKKSAKDSNVVVVLKYNTLDMRSKFCKKFSESITQFDRLSDSVLAKYIKNKANLPDNMCNILIDACSGSYGRILNELDKVHNIAEYCKCSDSDAFKIVYNNGNIHFDAYGEVFDIVNCFVSRDRDNFCDMSQESRFRGDNPILIISLLASSFKALLQVKLCNTKDIAKCTGLSGFQIKRSLENVKKYTAEELVRILKTLYFCDKAVRIGHMSSDIVLDYLAVNIF